MFQEGDFQNDERESGSRYIWLTRYGDERSDSMKNFPTEFVPMEELEESSPED